MVTDKRILVAAYSRSGHTRKLAEELARQARADFEPITDLNDRSGAWGFTRAAIESLLKTPTYLKAPEKDPSSYDLVIVGTPVWSGSVATPVRTYLRHFQGRFPDVAFFLTHGGSGARTTFDDMSGLVGKTPVATLALTEAELAKGKDAEKTRTFVEGLAFAASSMPYSAPPKRRAWRAKARRG